MAEIFTQEVNWEMFLGTTPAGEGGRQGGQRGESDRWADPTGALGWGGPAGVSQIGSGALGISLWMFIPQGGAQPWVRGSRGCA